MGSDQEIMWSDRERDDLVATLLSVGPDAPTLCEGWQARHLAAHLYLRRHRPWAVRRTDDIAEDAGAPGAYRELVADFARPVGAASALRLMDVTFGDAANLAEYVIHHEDVRRPNGAPARTLAVGPAAALLAGLRPLAAGALRGCPVGVELVTPGGPARIVRTGPAPVRITGEAPDLALAVSGRWGAAEVGLEGPPRAVATVRALLTR